MSAELKPRFRTGAKICSGVIMILLVVMALGPGKWTPGDGSCADGRRIDNPRSGMLVGEIAEWFTSGVVSLNAARAAEREEADAVAVTQHPKHWRSTT